MKALALVSIVLAWAAVALGDVPKEVNTSELIAQVRAALEQGKAAEAVTLAERLVAKDRTKPQYWLLLGLGHGAAGDHAKAVADLTQVLALDPKMPAAYDLRGSAEFKTGQIEASIRDFDKFLELVPAQEPYHWRRGISYYYAGRFDDGAKQFAAYQTVDDNDVENAVWRFLCMARSVGVDEARKSLLKIKRDPRVPMMEIYALFAGKATPEEVLAAAKAGNPGADELRERLFYAEMYIGLYCEVTGDAAGAKQHILTAADKYMIGHYMGDVARVHAERLRKP